MSKLTAGQFFPNFTVDTLYGGTQLIRDMLGAGKTVFWCLRYIGCTVCRYDIHLMAQRYGEIEAKGAKVYFLLQSEKSVLKEELSGLTLPFDIICDPAMKIYEALDIQPAESMKALLGDGLKKLQAKGAAAAEAGFSHGKYEGNEQQLPALFIVDAAGKVLTAHYARDIMDMPTIDEVLAQL